MWDTGPVEDSSGLGGIVDAYHAYWWTRSDILCDGHWVVDAGGVLPVVI